METRISDFALAQRALDIICYQYDYPFVDVPIHFGDEPASYRDGVFHLEENASLHKTIFSIVFLYLHHLLDEVPDEDRQAALSFVLALVRDFKHRDPALDFEGIGDDEIGLMRLDQNPFIWLVMRDIICPSRDIKLRNLRVVASKSSVIDIAKCVREDEVNHPDLDSEDFPLLFMNLDVNSFAIRTAALFVEALRAHVDDPEEAIRDLFSDFFMRDKIISFVRMVFVDDRDEADFFATLSILCQSQELEKLAVEGAPGGEKDGIKEAQWEGNQSNWWFLGLTEKMLEPARSEDWTVYEMWKPVTEELWSEVEAERRKRGLDEVPFDLMLDITRNLRDQHTDETKTLQALLADDRIW